MVNYKSIKGKTIGIVQSHNEALECWWRYKRDGGSINSIITFDYHTDLHKPFQRYSWNGVSVDEEKIRQCMDIVRGSSEDDIHNVIEKLQNDEQLKTAVESGIVSQVFVVAYDASASQYATQSEEEKYNFENWLDIRCGTVSSKLGRTYNEEQYYVADWNTLEDFDNKDECSKWILDDKFLSGIFKLFSMFKYNVEDKTNDFLGQNYILDIDLDCFTNLESLEPKNKNIFYNLIANAGLITIAIEEEFVRSCSNNKMEALKSLDLLEKHIEKALS